MNTTGNGSKHELNLSSGEKDLERLIRSLTENLRSTAGVYGKVYEIEKEKQARIVASDAAGILETIDDGKQVCEQVAVLDNERQMLQTTIGRVLGMQKRPTVREIADAIDPEVAGDLLEIRSVLLTTLGDLDKVHQSNAFLISRSLEALDQVLGAVFGQLRQGSTYQKTGQMQRESVDGTLVSGTY